MAERPFIAVLPKPLKAGDEIILKGKIASNASQFSVNFALNQDPIPDKIAYHFKTTFESNKVVHNSKNGCWDAEIEEDNHWIDGPGDRFILTFHFLGDKEILVYTGDDEREMHYRFNHQFDANQIETVQVWDDVHHVSEITFRYAKEE